MHTSYSKLDLYTIEYAVLVKMPLNKSEPRENGEKGVPMAVHNLGLQWQQLSGERKQKHKFIILVEICKIAIERIRYQITE